MAFGRASFLRPPASHSGAQPHDDHNGEVTMTFQDSIKTCLTKYADFSDRAVRSEYWWFFLFTLHGPFARLKF